MAKITDKDRQRYHEKVKVFSTMTKALLKTEKDLLMATRDNTPESSIKKLSIVDEMLNLASGYMAVNGVSLVVLKVKNEEALNDARKALYKAVIYLEGIVTNEIDVPFSEIEEKLSLIGTFDPDQRYNLIRKMGLAIDMLEYAYGDNSKWKWSFVELEGRFAVVAKNIMDMRNAYNNSSSDSEYYESTVYHLRLIKELLERGASRYRDKYELSTQQLGDFKTGLLFLRALRRLHVILSEPEEAEAVKKKIGIWKIKMEADIKRKEDARRKV